MTLVGDQTTLEGRETVRPGVLRRAWSLPVRAHVGALALVLLALVPLVGTTASFSTDEGAAIIEAQSLARGHGWVVPHPFPAVDPDGRHFPLELSEHGRNGFVAFGKHPLYAVILAGVDRVGGVTAMVLLSLAGTVAAAALSAALARRIDPALARPALWVVGLASPLLFDGFLVMAHTMGAALATAAVLVAVVAVERHSRALATATAPLVAGAVLLRNEAVFLALGLAMVAGAIALRRPLERAAAAVVGLGALGGGLGAHVLETWWLARLIGNGTASIGSAPAAGDPGGYLRGRVHGFSRTVLTPTYGGNPLVAILLVTMVAGVVISAVTVRNHPDRGGPIVAGGLIAAAAAVVAVLMGPRAVVPGLLVAFPLVGAGLVLVRRVDVCSLAARIPAAVFAMFALCVVMGQYAVGGATEWGGRFFALGLPSLVPVLLLAMKDRGATLDARVGRAAVVALSVCSLAMATLSITSIRSQHRRLGQLVAKAEQAGRQVATADPGDRPVMVATYGSVPRWAWSTFDDQRWLTTTPADLTDLISRLRAAGVPRIGVVTPDLLRDRPLLGSSAILSDVVPGRAPGWHILVLQIA